MATDKDKRGSMHRILALGVSVAIALTSCGLFRGPVTEPEPEASTRNEASLSRGEATIGQEGATVEFEGIRVEVPPGAAPEGTVVSASFDPDALPVIDPAVFNLLSDPVKITMDKNEQPDLPLTVTLPVDTRLLASPEEDFARGSSVALMVQSEGSTEPEFFPATWDEASSSLTAKLPHLSWVWPVQVDLQSAVLQVLGLEYPEPPCTSDTAIVQGTRYLPVAASQAWLCLRESDGSLSVDVYPNSPLPFLVTSAPRSTVSLANEVSVTGIVSTAVANQLHLNGDGTAVVMPSVGATFSFNSAPTTAELQFVQSPPMMLVRLLAQVLDVVIGRYVNSSAIEGLECVQDIVNTGSMDDHLSAEAAAGISNSFFSCVGPALNLNFATGVLLSIVSGAPQFLVANFLGIANEITGEGRFNVRIDGIGGSKTFMADTGSGTVEFDYPSDWVVEESASNGPPGTLDLIRNLSVRDESGFSVATLDVLGVWDGGCYTCKPRTAQQISQSSGREPLSGSGPFQVKTLAMNLSDYPEEISLYQWGDKVQVTTSLHGLKIGPWESGDAISPNLMFGLGQIKTGNEERYVSFGASQYFSTMEQAVEYVDSSEHAKLVAMISSFRG